MSKLLENYYYCKKSALPDMYPYMEIHEFLPLIVLWQYIHIPRQR
jgi:hypothetical protein